MMPSSPLFPIHDAVVYSEYLNLKTHRYLHVLYSNYSKEVQENITCKECQSNRDKTAAARMAAMRQREKLIQHGVPYWQTDLQSSPGEGIDLGLVNFLVGSPDKMVVEISEDTLKIYKNSLLALISERKNVCLEDISPTKAELLLNVVAMLYLAQDDKIEGFEQRENRIWVW